MNWKEIKKKYPKAWILLKEWFGYKKDMTVSMELSKIFMPERKLYDFFDEQRIMIWCLWDNHPNVQWFHCVISYNDKETHSVDWDVPNWKVRKEMEEAAFLKAFEILENNNQGE